MTNKGKIVLILGSMMSSKSSVLLTYLERAKYARKTVCLARPESDTRKYVTRKLTKCDCPVYQVKDLKDANVKQFNTIGVDEGQFINGIGPDAHQLALEGHNIIIAALAGDSDMKPWDNISELLPFVDEIVKLNAVCSECGEDKLGTFTLYEGVKTSQVIIGDGKNDPYKAVCRQCYKKHKS